MIYHSPSPFEIGAFDVDEAAKLAEEIALGGFKVHRTESSGRIVLDEKDEITRALSRISFYNATEDNSKEISTSVYSQDFTEIIPPFFSGLPWHIDVDNAKGGNSTAFDFNFGSSTHPTEFVVGRLDLNDAANRANSVLGKIALPNEIFIWSQKLVCEAIATAVESGDASVGTMEEGILYRVPSVTLHRMQPFDFDRVYPPRLCVEQYYKP